MHYLAAGVHPGIRAPTTGNANLVIGHDTQGMLKAALYGGFLSLNLPAVKPASIVFQA
jgi:hypothetical protein